ncbi:MAG: glycosyltransferase [Clostridia bacterium]|nr:glycosyltransferase [Clostridia bacterium]
MKKDLPLISIIVPVYNVEAYLTKCLDSILEQSYKNIEVILVDDGSIDNSGPICDEYAVRDQRIKVIHQKNAGLSGARNAGLEVIVGDYIMFVDSDDWISSATCETAIKNTLENDADIVFWSYIREYSDRSLPRYIYDKDITFEDTSYEELLLRVLGNTNSPEMLDSLSSACNKCYRVKNIAEKVRFVDTKYIGTEDLLYNVEMFLLSKKACYIHEAFYHYRKTAKSSLTSIYNDDLINKRKNLFNALVQALPADVDEVYHNALEKRIALDSLGQFLNVIQSNKKATVKYKLIHNILHDDMYRPALRNLSTKGMKIHWRLYYGMAKFGFCPGVYILSYAIKILKRMV